MKTSEDGVRLIKSFEGLRLDAYPDPGTGGDPWTIGYGTTRGVVPGMTITEAEAEELLVDDLAAFERAVMTLLPVEMSQGEFDALVRWFTRQLDTWKFFPGCDHQIGKTLVILELLVVLRLDIFD